MKFIFMTARDVSPRMAGASFTVWPCAWCILIFGATVGSADDVGILGGLCADLCGLCHGFDGTTACHSFCRSIVSAEPYRIASTLGSAPPLPTSSAPAPNPPKP